MTSLNLPSQFAPSQLDPAQLTITRPDDWHLHLRDGSALGSVVAATAAQFARAIVMPNLKPPVTTVSHAWEYKARIDAALLAAAPHLSAQFQALMTLYLTDNTDPEEVTRAKASGVVQAFKLYPAGATTNSDAGVSALPRIAKALERMEKEDMPLLVHGELTTGANGEDVDVFDREARFIDAVMEPLRKDFPALRVVFEHITTKQAAQYVAQATGRVGATITPQHLLYNRNALFKGGVRPHWYCLPILKREEHRLALVAAATSGNPRFFLGTDSAPHAKHLKEHACGCAGCYSAPHALELYALAFERANALDKLEGFASWYGADFYGLPRNTSTIVLKRQEWTIPEYLSFEQTNAIVPLAAGEKLPWKLQA
jgi:dihydroorotase